MRTLSERMSPRATRRLGNAALALSLTFLLSAEDCSLSGGTVSYPAGFAFRTPQRNSQCTAWASGDWVDAGSQLSWVIGGYAPRPGACGFVVRSDTNRVAVKAKIRIPCSQVGNDPSPPAGHCNNGASSTANIVEFTNLSVNQTPTHVDG